jgi:hypothetical protein
MKLVMTVRSRKRGRQSRNNQKCAGVADANVKFAALAANLAGASTAPMQLFADLTR